jgi:general secretion pathway protein E
MARLPLEQLAAFLAEAGHIGSEQQVQLTALWKDRNAKVKDNRKLDPIAFIMGLNIPDKLHPEAVIGDVTIARLLAQKSGLPTVKLDPLKLDMEFVHKTVSRPFAARFLMVPLAERDGHILMAVADPFDAEGIDVFRQTSPLPVKRLVTAYGDLVRIIHEFYGLRASLSKAERTLTQGGDLGNLEQLVRLQSGTEIEASEKHVVNAVEYLLHHAYDLRASDIHLEPKRDHAVVRFRIDGVLHEISTIPKVVYPAIVNRIKALSRMDISEKRRPQDGRIKTEREGKEVELRISTVPVAFGEKIVMRIFDPDMLIRDLSSLGFGQDELEIFEEFIGHPHGIILVTGPTGSGKTTTLYSALKILAQPGVNVTTIEDPIEMVMPQLNQIAVHAKIGLTFAHALRTILRQDPDIIMVGEIRDMETADNAVQAALTGHLVLSTLHTNDAPSAITRLQDLGIPNFLLSSTLLGIMAQRLVRMICPRCKEDHLLGPEELRILGIPPEKQTSLLAKRGRGCASCRKTGYYGRTGIYEILKVDEVMRDLIERKADAVMLRDRAVQNGMVTLKEAALAKLARGVTTFEEILRVTGV